MLSSNIKNEQQIAFHKKLKAKDGAKVKLFMLSLILGYFQLCITFFGGTFLQFSQKFFMWYTILHVYMPIFYFIKNIF